MTRKLSGCRKCRKSGVKLCSKGPKCVTERRSTSPGQHGRRVGMKKVSEYGRQLQEKQKVKLMYGLLEKQFRRFFATAAQKKGVTGEILLSMLERRLDNVVYRLKMASSRGQSRQAVVHGHVYVNGGRVKSPSYLVDVGDIISLSEGSLQKSGFINNVVNKRMNMGIRVPEWLELQKKEYKGTIVRLPIRSDVPVQIEEHLIIELYSK